MINVRRRFPSGGLQAAPDDQGWPGAPPTFTGDVDAKVMMVACSDPPAGAARGTLRLLADTMVELGSVDSIRHGTVGELLKKRNQAQAGNVLGHWQAVWDVCRHDGRRVGRGSATL